MIFIFTQIKLLPLAEYCFIYGYKITSSNKLAVISVKDTLKQRRLMLFGVYLLVGNYYLT